MKDLIVHKGAERPKSCVVRLCLKGRSGGFYLPWVSFRFLSQVSSLQRKKDLTPATFAADTRSWFLLYGGSGSFSYSPVLFRVDGFALNEAWRG